MGLPATWRALGRYVYVVQLVDVNPSHRTAHSNLTPTEFAENWKADNQPQVAQPDHLPGPHHFRHAGPLCK